MTSNLLKLIKVLHKKMEKPIRVLRVRKEGKKPLFVGKKPLDDNFQ